MRAAALAVLALAVFAEGRILLQKDDDPNQALGIRPDTDTVFALGGDQTGLVQITGMLQNFPLDEAEDVYSINDLLDRPTTSYLDVTWSNWIDQRLEMLDLVQDMLAAPVRPRCPHMQPAASAMDNGMVSYLASSRFGPAILTTYAQQEDEGESDFDWDEVNIPEGNAIGRSYEDASLRDELSADADKAFKLAELESKLLSQESNLGYFGANKKPSKDQIMFNQLDGDYESVQPMILTHPNMLELVEQQQRAFRDESDPKGPPPVDPEVDPKQMALAILLFIGCCYVWTCLAVSCIRMRQQLQDKDAISGSADDLLIPLAPEGMKNKEGIEVASASVAPGDYYAPNGTSFVRIAVPLMTTEAPRST